MKYIVKYDDNSVFQSEATFDKLKAWRELPDDKKIRALYYRLPGTANFVMLSGYEAYNLVVDFAVDVVGGAKGQTLESCVEYVHLFGRRGNRVKHYSVVIRGHDYENLRRNSIQSAWTLAEEIGLLPKKFRHEKQFQLICNNLKTVPKFAEHLTKELGEISEHSKIQSITPHLNFTGDEELDTEIRLVRAMIATVTIDSVELQEYLRAANSQSTVYKASLFSSLVNAIDHFKDIKASPGELKVSDVRLGKELYGESLKGWKVGVTNAKSKQSA